jgi:hypothetical protein
LNVMLCSAFASIRILLPDSSGISFFSLDGK